MNLDKIFKAYDIRGVYPKQIDRDMAYLIGGGLVKYLNAESIAVGRDMRVSGEDLFEGLAEGITDAGAMVVNIGMVSTDALYYTVGNFGFTGGVMITASHNPSEYNGFKICKEEARPLSGKDGLPEIRKAVEAGSFEKADKKGAIVQKDILDDFSEFLMSFVDVEKFKPFKVAIDAGNGMAGEIVPRVFDKLPFEVEKLYFDLDGSFPNHPANPIEPDNTAKIREMVEKNRDIDFGAAFDGDADRMFMIDDKGNLVDSSMVAAIASAILLKKNPGEKIIHNIICSKTVAETIRKHGGEPIMTPVGHAIIKPIMRENNAIFGAEHSGHFYFRDFWFADSGILAFLIVAEMLSETEKKLSQLIDEIDNYKRSGEINSRVDDRKATLEKVAKYYQEKYNVEPVLMDGVTFDLGDWWFNIRPSNTEPLIRLNLEAKTEQMVKEKVDEALSVIRGK
ncbi:MAG: phosphomannomutase/phosphoglucomutase [Candidatus Zixiibacteriota bacterium]